MTEADDLVISNKADQYVVKEEPVLDEMFDDMLDSSTEVNPNLNMANPEYIAKLVKIKKAEIKVYNGIKRFPPQTLKSKDLTNYKDSLI